MGPGRELAFARPGYDVAGLLADTIALLSPDAPVLTRMENMRRATIYADRDPAIAGALLGAVLARTRRAGRPRAPRPSRGSTRAISSRPIGSST